MFPNKALLKIVLGVRQSCLRVWLICSASLILSFFSAPSYSEEILIAVASNFVAPMKALAEHFEQQRGDKVTMVSGSSGKLYAQIVNGAPFQIFFSADQAKPLALDQGGISVPGSRTTYAQGRLALVSAESFEGKLGSKETDSKSINALEKLERGDYRRLAIANPRVAPYGAAAIEVLDNLKIDSEAGDRLVQGQNISQTYHFVATGNVDIGLVSLSQVVGNENLDTDALWIVPESLHNPIAQDVVLLEETPGVINFYEWLSSNEAQAIIADYGYETVTASVSIQ